MRKKDIRVLVGECARLESALESLRNAEEERKLTTCANQIIYYLHDNQQKAKLLESRDELWARIENTTKDSHYNALLHYLSENQMKHDAREHKKSEELRKQLMAYAIKLINFCKKTLKEHKEEKRNRSWY